MYITALYIRQGLFDKDDKDDKKRADTGNGGATGSGAGGSGSEALFLDDMMKYDTMDKQIASELYDPNKYFKIEKGMALCTRCGEEFDARKMKVRPCIVSHLLIPTERPFIAASSRDFIICRHCSLSGSPVFLVSAYRIIYAQRMTMNISICSARTFKTTSRRGSCCAADKHSSHGPRIRAAIQKE